MFYISRSGISWKSSTFYNISWFKSNARRSTMFSGMYCDSSEVSSVPYFTRIAQRNALTSHSLFFSDSGTLYLDRNISDYADSFRKISISDFELSRNAAIIPNATANKASPVIMMKHMVTRSVSVVPNMSPYPTLVTTFMVK
jgi:hypothetical protein